jgi:hypothetical protein
MFNNQVNSAFDGNNFTKRVLYLFVDTKMLVNGYFAFVKLYDVNLIGGNGADICLISSKIPWIIDMNIVE